LDNIFLLDYEKNKIKNWLYTGYTTTIYNKNNNENINYKLLLKNIAFTKNILLYSINKSLKKENQIYALCVLTLGSIHAKKIFKELFPIIIINFNDLFLFLSLLKKMRGFGSIIKDTITKWIRSKSFNFLQEQIITYKKSYGWTFKDVLKTLHIKPRNILEGELFKYVLGSKTRRIYQNLLIIKKYEELKKEENVINTIQELKINSSLFPGNIKKENNILENLFLNMSGKEILKNINKFNKNFILENKKYICKKIINENLFNLLFLTNKIKDDEIKKEIIQIILTKKNNKKNNNITMFIDSDLEYSHTNSINNIIFPYIIDKNYNTIFFFKNKIIDKKLEEIKNLICFNTFNWVTSYASVYCKHLLNMIREEQNIIIIWLNNKNFILQEEDYKKLHNKKLIIITSKENVKLNKNYNNIYLLQNINSFSFDLLNLIIEGII